MATKKRYWLKLHQNFLDSNEIAVLEGEENGHTYILLWLRLLLLCLGKEEHDCGFMRLNDNIPYSPDLLARIFKMNIDIVRVGIEKFIQLGMLDVLDDGTYYIECIQGLIGKESDSAERVRNHREKKKLLLCNGSNVTLKPYKEKEEEKNKSKKEKEKESRKKKDFVPPTLEEVKEYCIEKNITDFDYKKFFDIFTKSDWTDSKNNKVKNWKNKLAHYTGYDQYKPSKQNDLKETTYSKL